MQYILTIGNSLIRIFVKNPIIQIVVAIVIIFLSHTCGNTHKQPNPQNEEKTKNGSIKGKIKEAVEEKRKSLEIE